jgi:hypothetical protein
MGVFMRADTLAFLLVKLVAQDGGHVSQLLGRKDAVARLVERAK